MVSVLVLPAADTAALLLDVLITTLSATALGQLSYNPDGPLSEVLLNYLNPAGHALLAQLEQPAPAFSTYFPVSQRPTVLALCQ